MGGIIISGQEGVSMDAGKKERAVKLAGKDAVYMYICAAALLCAAVLLTMTFIRPGKAETVRAPAVKPTPAATAPAGTPNVGSKSGKQSLIRLSGAEFEAVLSAALPKDLPIENLTVTFTEDLASARGKTDRDGLISYLEASGAEIPPLVRAALGIFPPQTEIGIDFSLPETDGTAVRFKPVSISVGGVSLDAGMIPESLITSLDNSLNDTIAAYGDTVSRVYIKGGELVVEFK
jgi:hypothetical protein